MTAAPPADLTLETLLRFSVALAAVLALILAAGWLLRRLIEKGVLPGALLPAATGRAQRLAVVEIRQLDARRRLVLIRRDGVEHLLLLGATGDLVIESGIVPPPAVPNPEASP
ncbi:MAG: flagellar biosynthetic protein FliO [Rhodospirillaceae bacterium]